MMWHIGEIMTQIKRDTKSMLMWPQNTGGRAMVTGEDLSWGELLGLSEPERAAPEAQGIIGTRPVAPGAS
jgi:hypothetical protein